MVVRPISVGTLAALLPSGSLRSLISVVATGRATDLGSGRSLRSYRVRVTVRAWTPVPGFRSRSPPPAFGSTIARSWRACTACSRRRASTRTWPATSRWRWATAPTTCGRRRGASGGTRSARPTCAGSTPHGTVVDGRWPVSPAIFLHTELHRSRPDAAGRGAQPPVPRHAARDDGPAPRDHAPGRVHVRRRPPPRRRVPGPGARRRRRRVARRRGGRRHRDHPAQPRRDRDRRVGRGGRRTGRSRSSGCVASPPTR